MGKFTSKRKNEGNKNAARAFIVLNSTIQLTLLQKETRLAQAQSKKCKFNIVENGEKMYSNKLHTVSEE